jgi:hypothetical protein
MPHAGVKDPQTVVAGGGRASAPKILGVQIFELGNVITRSGFITEVFRTDWPVVSISVRQVNWVQLNAGAPILDALASEVRRANLPLSLCGVARPDDASLPDGGFGSCSVSPLRRDRSLDIALVLSWRAVRLESWSGNCRCQTMPH